jgi:hypothetical protein
LCLSGPLTGPFVTGDFRSIFSPSFCS